MCILKIRTVMLTMAVGALGAAAYAKDLGIQAQVWQITEVDMRQLLVASASRVDWDQVEEDTAKSSKTYLDHLPRHEMGETAQTRTRWMDPSFVLDQDIKVPVNDGSGNWRVLFPKGTRANPLAVTRPDRAMLFFDGTSKEQTDFALKALSMYPATLMLIEATGANPEDLAKRAAAPVYTINDAVRGRFQITVTPALVYPGEGEQRMLIGITAYAPPYNTALLEPTWHELNVGAGTSAPAAHP